MKKFIKENWFKLGILIIILVVGIFYIINCKSSATEVKTVDIFEKNKECYKYKDDLVKEAGERNKIDARFTYSVGEIFYSPTLKTCLNIRETSNLNDKGLLDSYALVDILQNKTISTSGWVNFDGGDMTLKNTFFESVENYKN